MLRRRVFLKEAALRFAVTAGEHLREELDIPIGPNNRIDPGGP
jgi:hypothetical protein